MSILNASKKMMGKAGAAPPLSLSGSWESSNDGWTFSGVGRSNTSQNARTGTYSVQMQSSNNMLSRTLQYSSYRNLQLTVSVYIMQVNGGGNYVDIGYVNDAGDYVVNSRHTIGGDDVYRLASSTFPKNPVGPNPLTIFMSISGLPVRIDDWRISGVKP